MGWGGGGGAAAMTASNHREGQETATRRLRAHFGDTLMIFVVFHISVLRSWNESQSCVRHRHSSGADCVSENVTGGGGKNPTATTSTRLVTCE